MALSENIKINEHCRFIKKMLKEKKFRLVAYGDNKLILLATTIYLDGDALSEIYSQNGYLPIADNRDKLDEHFETFGKYFKRLRNTSRTVKTAAIIGMTALAFGLSENYIHNLALQIGITGGTFSLGIFLRRFFPKVIFGILSRIGTTYFKS